MARFLSLVLLVSNLLLRYLIDFQDLEDSLLIDGAAEGEETSFLPDLLARLLRGLYRTKDIK